MQTKTKNAYEVFKNCTEWPYNWSCNSPVCVFDLSPTLLGEMVFN